MSISTPARGKRAPTFLNGPTFIPSPSSSRSKSLARRRSAPVSFSGRLTPIKSPGSRETSGSPKSPTDRRQRSFSGASNGVERETVKVAIRVRPVKECIPYALKSRNNGLRAVFARVPNMSFLPAISILHTTSLTTFRVQILK